MLKYPLRKSNAPNTVLPDKAVKSESCLGIGYWSFGEILFNLVKSQHSLSWPLPLLANTIGAANGLLEGEIKLNSSSSSIRAFTSSCKWKGILLAFDAGGVLSGGKAKVKAGTFAGFLLSILARSSISQIHSELVSSRGETISSFKSSSINLESSSGFGSGQSSKELLGILRFSRNKKSDQDSRMTGIQIPYLETLNPETWRKFSRDFKHYKALGGKRTWPTLCSATALRVVKILSGVTHFTTRKNCRSAKLSLNKVFKVTSPLGLSDRLKDTCMKTDLTIKALSLYVDKFVELVEAAPKALENKTLVQLFIRGLFTKRLRVRVLTAVGPDCEEYDETIKVSFTQLSSLLSSLEESEAVQKQMAFERKQGNRFTQERKR
ncbi:hypothetical protein ADUPG1_008262, partial [Aduncisulcus paluster]